MKFLFHELWQSAKLLALALFLSLGVSYAFAWTGPTSAPPGTNTPAPLNVGATSQVKVGDLGVSALTAASTTVSGNMTAGSITSSGDVKISGSGKITTNGSNSTYGAVTVQGSKNTWSGINFKDVNGTNSGTLMMNPSGSGFFNQADNNWRLYVDEGGNLAGPGGAHPSQNSCYWVYVSTNGAGYCAVGYYVAGISPVNESSTWVNSDQILCCQF